MPGPRPAVRSMPDPVTPLGDARSSRTILPSGVAMRTPVRYRGGCPARPAAINSWQFDSKRFDSKVRLPPLSLCDPLGSVVMMDVPVADSVVEDVEVMLARMGSVLDAADLGSLDVDDLGRVVASVRRAQSRLDAVIVRAGLRSAELTDDGAPPARDLLIGTGEVRGATARREAARSALAARDARLAQLMGSGQLGPDHLDVLVHRLARLHDDHLADVLLHDVVERGHGWPADTFDRALRGVVELTATTESDPDEADGASFDANASARAASEVRHWFDRRTGMGQVSAQLDPERYEAVTAALDAQMTALANAQGEGTEKNAALAADAFVELVLGATSRAGGRARPLVTVVVDEQTLRRGRHPQSVAETADGHGLSDGAIARLCCDAVVQRVVVDGHGLPIDVGRRHRTATAAQWTALRGLYSTCGWMGCDALLSWCEAHHIRFWEHGGPTDLDNLVPLCSHHHHLVHDRRWRIELSAERALRILRPDGRLHGITSPPTRRPPPARGRRQRQPAGTAL